MSETAYALDGRALGSRGLRTRRQLLDATEELLRERALREIRVVDIARRVGTSPATFYQYFRDVEDAVLQLAEDTAAEVPGLVELLGEDWGDDGFDKACRLVERFLEYWQVHHPVLRVRNLAAEEGDERFRAVRLRSVRQITNALAAALRRSQREGLFPARLDPYAVASVIVAMLERVGAYQDDLEAFGITRQSLVEAPAAILFQIVTGRTLDMS